MKNFFSTCEKINLSETAPFLYSAAFQLISTAKKYRNFT